jgi:hypothetical protein
MFLCFGLDPRSGAAGEPLPGEPYAWLLTGLPGHTIEHASQIRQFMNDHRRGEARDNFIERP